MSAPVVFVSAGEPSGDAHAARLVGALRRQRPDIAVEGFGGPHLAAAGAVLMERMEHLTVIGFVEVLRKVPAHWRLLNAMERRFRRGDVKLVVVVDYPGFHMRVAHAARRAGVPVLYYVAPQLWAWHESRVKRLARDVSRLAVILPFEEAFFRARGIDATYVGHPLLDRPSPGPREAVKAALGLDPARPVLGLFPGSRGQETRRLWPVFRAAAALVQRQRPDVQCLVAATATGHYPDAGAIHVVQDRPGECFAAADAALCKSGTTTLEAALAGAPMVVAYRLNALTWLLARRLVTVRWASLVNLVADHAVVPELLQGAATSEALAAAVGPLLDPGSAERTAQLAGIAEVRARLGAPGAADRAAAIAAELLSA